MFYTNNSTLGKNCEITQLAPDVCEPSFLRNFRTFIIIFTQEISECHLTSLVLKFYLISIFQPNL